MKPNVDIIVLGASGVRVCSRTFTAGIVSHIGELCRQRNCTQIQWVCHDCCHRRSASTEPEGVLELSGWGRISLGLDNILSLCSLLGWPCVRFGGRHSSIGSNDRIRKSKTKPKKARRGALGVCHKRSYLEIFGETRYTTRCEADVRARIGADQLILTRSSLSETTVSEKTEPFSRATSAMRASARASPSLESRLASC